MLPLLALLGALAQAAGPVDSDRVLRPDGSPQAAAPDLADVHAIAEALGRVQNAWAAHTILSGVPPCEHGEARTLVTRARMLGAELHSRLVPLMATYPDDPEVDALVGRYLAGVAFQEKVVEPRGGACAAPSSPAPGVGPQPPPSQPVAIIALMGVVCPGLEPGDGSVMVVRGPVCSTPFGSCDCTPRPVLPGEVVGP